jgi:integrase
MALNMAGTDRLTDRAIRALKPRPKAYLVRDGRGLYLKVQPGGARSWLLRYQLAGKVHDLGLGPYPEVSLARAREKALAARRQKADGLDPLAARRAEREAKRSAEACSLTFRAVAERYIAAHENGWRNRVHTKQWPVTLMTYAYPEIGDLPVAAIDTVMIVRILEPIWTTKAETASRVRQRIEAVLDYAKALGYRRGENPAAWKGNLVHTLPAMQKAKAAARRETGRGEHHAAMPYAELPAFMRALRGRDGLAARCLEFVILTACRTGEAIGATWPEIDEEARLWVIPAGRMKSGREHRVPLSEPAVAIPEALPGDHAAGRAFPVSNMAMAMLLRRMGRSDLTVHGFRSTFSDWVAEQTNFPAEVREMALAHAVGDKVEAAYRRGDLFGKRRQLAEAWALYCAGEDDSAKVVPLRQST